MGTEDIHETFTEDDPVGGERACSITNVMSPPFGGTLIQGLDHK